MPRRGGRRGGRSSWSPSRARSTSPAANGEDKKEIHALSPSDYKMEVKHLEGRYDKSGYQRIAEPLEGPPVLNKHDKWRSWAIQQVRYFNNEGEHTHTTVSVKSPFMKALLKRVIGDKYPNVSFLTTEITIASPPKACYHYLPELRADVETLEGEEERKHCDFFLEWLEEEFREVTEEMQNLSSEGLITYPLLWALFKPGEIVYSPQGEHDRARAYAVKSYSYTCGMNPAFNVSTSFLTYDGTHFGYLGDATKIRPFAGTRKITKLPLFPLDRHPAAESIREKLVARGKKFERLRGKQYMHYSGLTRPDWDETIQRAKTSSINGPIMIDREIYSRIVPDRSRRMLETRLDQRRRRRRDGYDSDSDDEGSDIEPLDADEEAGESTAAAAAEAEHWRRPEDPPGYRPLTPEQHLICESSVYGFSFTEKVWGRFYVDLVAPPQWNDNAFDQLVLPPTQKKLVRALVDSHVRGSQNFDDFIKGKGRGLVVILHGPPGVGKTLTAESVSHASRRPLYMVSSGELGINAKELEDNLARILEVASAWKAVVLLDEADVFLEKRSEHDLMRNALVSIFLRLLEYYQGILFLTTNRVRAFDEAFQSRIHVALKYGDLEKEARRSVWRNFLEKVPGAKVTEEGLNTLAKHPLNGREIKNAIGTAKTLADAEGEPLDVERLEEVLQIQEEFEKEMRAPEGGMYM